MVNKIYIFQTTTALFQVMRPRKNFTFEKNSFNFLRSSFMILVRFGAGLGNQMLQYANYLALQERYPNANIKADISGYNFAKIHNGLEIERLFPLELNVMFGKRSNKVSRLGKYWHFAMHNLTTVFFKIGFTKFRLIKDSGVFDKELFNLDNKKNYCLQGQWGNVKYFENVEELLRERFAFKLPLDPVNTMVAEKIGQDNSISVHIRRGDYIGSFFVELSKSDYYPQAFNYMSQKVSNPVFYIFSDDAEWCRQNLTWLNKYEHCFIEGNTGKESYKDMQLMSLCKHNVIANSTFSWWGGWLNSNREKIIICPNKLFYDEEKNNKIVQEFYPDSWIKM